MLVKKLSVVIFLSRCKYGTANFSVTNSLNGIEYLQVVSFFPYIGKGETGCSIPLSDVVTLKFKIYFM